MRKFATIFFSGLSALLLASSCSSSRRAVVKMDRDNVRATLALPESSMREFRDLDTETLRKDTIVVEGPEEGALLVMNAVKDEESGEMVASDRIQAAVVTARFRNVAERNGLVDFEFQVMVPEEMMDSGWQLRLYPDLYMLGDSTRLEPVVITGERYRREQLKGYERYRRFLDGIIGDKNLLVNQDQFELFLSRNMLYGVDEEEALRHYTDKLLERINDRKAASKGKMYSRYVKAPIEKDGLRIDTVMSKASGGFVYDYLETVRTRPKLRKADIVLSGEILENGSRIYTVPRSDSLTFYISSLSAFAQTEERYLTKVIERRAYADASYRIVFESGKSDFSEKDEDNARSVASISSLLKSLAENRVYDIDSIVVTATASPEGPFGLNRELSRKRGETVIHKVSAILKGFRDSLLREQAFAINLDDGFKQDKGVPDISFNTRVLPENWEALTRMVEADSLLSSSDKKEYGRILLNPDPDRRSAELEKMSFFPYVRNNMYPLLRTVKFEFSLHRKGMVKDTVHTTVLDTVYMEGLRALRDHDYGTAVTLLGPYKDFNSAVAYCAMGYNHSALEILESCERTAKVNYMLALLWSRLGNPGKAVNSYLQSCRQDPSFVYRGNLDPEIYLLVRQYGLNKEENQIQ